MAKFFINRPIVAIVISILTVIGGVVAMAKLPIAQLPDIVPPQVNVAAVYTGADALSSPCTSRSSAPSSFFRCSVFPLIPFRSLD
jgi:AcrB/AcrD/AcrF family